VGDQINASQEAILHLMKANPRIPARVIAEQVGITQRQVESNIAKLKSLGLIERAGPDRTGTWLVR
jgi:ATP-dependent DNA helicase RecG